MTQKKIFDCDRLDSENVRTRRHRRPRVSQHRTKRVVTGGVCRILLYLRDRRCTLILTFVAVLLLVIVVVVLNVLQEVGLSTR